MILAGLFHACQEDEKIILQKPGSFVLNVPKSASGIYELEQTETIELTTTQPDYGFTAATLYAVQISLEESFTNYASLPGTYSTAKFEVPAQDMAVALVALHGAEDESQYPAGTHPLHVRLTATIAGTNVEPVLSNVITLPRVKGYYALEAVTLPEEMYLVGNVAGNWDWNGSTEMIPVWGSEGKFWAMQYLGQTDEGDNAQIKFNYAMAWDDNEFGFNEVTIGESSAALAGTSDAGGNIEIGNPGWYIVVVTTAVEGREYAFTVDFHEPYVYLQGDINGGSWGTTDEAHRFAIPSLSLGANAEFVSPPFANNQEVDVRASIQLPNHEWWHTEFMVFDGVFVPRGAEDDQDRVGGTTGQRLSINFTERTGKIE